MSFLFRRRAGFTMIELLVVISIIAVLSAIGVASFTGSQKRARDARRQADLEAVRSALELYRADNPVTGYPASTAPLSPTYMSAIPVDPRTQAAYPYVGGGTTYTLCATQEVILPANYCLSPP